MKAFLHVPLVNEAIAKKFGFSLVVAKAKRLKTGIVCITLDWRAKMDSHLFKYATNGGTSNTIGQPEKAASFFLAFPEVLWTYHGDVFHFEIEVGIKFSSRLSFDPLFFRNTKYGAILYFAPPGWDSSKEARTIPFDIIP